LTMSLNVAFPVIAKKLSSIVNIFPEFAIYVALSLPEPHLVRVSAAIAILPDFFTTAMVVID